MAHALDLPNELWLQIFMYAHENDPNVDGYFWLHTHDWSRLSECNINKRLAPLRLKAMAGRLDIAVGLPVSYQRGLQRKGVAWDEELTTTHGIMAWCLIAADFCDQLTDLRLFFDDEKDELESDCAFVKDSILPRFPRLQRLSFWSEGIPDDLLAAAPPTVTSLSLGLHYVPWEALSRLLSPDSPNCIRSLSFERLQCSDSGRWPQMPAVLPSLRHLNIGAQSDAALRFFLNSAPHLEHLEFYDCDCGNKTTLYTLVDAALPTTLKVLHLCTSNSEGHHTLSKLHRVAEKLSSDSLPLLQHLHLDIFNWRDRSFMPVWVKMLEGMKGLTHLSFDPDMIRPERKRSGSYGPHVPALLLETLRDESALPRLRSLDFGMSLKNPSNDDWPRFPEALRRVLADRRLVDATLEEWTTERIQTLGTRP